MVTMGVFPFQGKTQMVESGFEPGTSWLVVRSSNHQATKLVSAKDIVYMKFKASDSYEGISVGKVHRLPEQRFC